MKDIKNDETCIMSDLDESNMSHQAETKGLSTPNTKLKPDASAGAMFENGQSSFNIL